MSQALGQCNPLDEPTRLHGGPFNGKTWAFRRSSTKVVIEGEGDTAGLVIHYGASPGLPERDSDGVRQWGYLGPYEIPPKAAP